MRYPQAFSAPRKTSAVAGCRFHNIADHDAMMSPSLFAAQERDAKRNKLGGTSQVLDRHVDFASRAPEVDRASPRPDRSRGGRPPCWTKQHGKSYVNYKLSANADKRHKLDPQAQAQHGERTRH